MGTRRKKSNSKSSLCCRILKCSSTLSSTVTDNNGRLSEDQGKFYSSSSSTPVGTATTRSSSYRSSSSYSEEPGPSSQTESLMETSNSSEESSEQSEQSEQQATSFLEYLLYVFWVRHFPTINYGLLYCWQSFKNFVTRIWLGRLVYAILFELIPNLVFGNYLLGNIWFYLVLLAYFVVDRFVARIFGLETVSIEKLKRRFND